MLTDLSIRNFVLIEGATLRFKPGLNVLTGETGAGKSIVMDALAMVLGERASSDLIRTGKDQATVEAVFELDRDSTTFRKLSEFMEEAGLEMDDPLILKRTLSRNGKSRSYVNNSATTLSTLNEIGQILVDLHGQHDHQTLLDPRTYIGILDAFGGLEEDAASIASAYDSWKDARERYQTLLDQDREKNRLVDQYRFQVGEIEEARLKAGEEDELSAERRRLKNFESLNGHCAAILDLLDGREEESVNVLSAVGQLQSRLEEMAEQDPDLALARSFAETAAFALEDLARSVRQYHEGLEDEPGRLDEIESRLHLIQSLKRKYGATIEDILGFLHSSKEELARLENFEGERAALEKELQSLTHSLGKQATEISRKRRKVAKQLSGEITVELRQLGMETARFESEVTLIDPAQNPNILRMNYPMDNESPITRNGWDQVHFRISTNPGEPLKSLKQVASGGEISRVMLAIKAVLAKVDRVDVLVFDEIDSGIGGKTAHVVGGKIKSLSGERQVLCITHLAPIASKADHHLRIEKESDGQSTYVRITPLDEQSRPEEIARMMGADVSEGSIRMAEEMMHAGVR